MFFSIDNDGKVASSKKHIPSSKLDTIFETKIGQIILTILFFLQ